MFNFAVSLGQMVLSVTADRRCSACLIQSLSDSIEIIHNILHVRLAKLII